MKKRDWRIWLLLLCFLLAFCTLPVLYAVQQRSFHVMEALPPLKTETSEPDEDISIVNINTAGMDELCTLHGIGPKKAEAILAWREEHGPFRYPEELIYVSGIGEKTVLGFLNQITTGG